ncbi:Hypothetical protein PHPALM_9594 [Phytophthora palmivora]|uniref:HAT C-terminal dimerisation domain-containing protein n=1 Tax=Phytophthora palmivora TaxID=4796 RepID=A0A2P4Y793_9STRA|nr:Hypothetical protein PHPALM_9594 [Phytophthora palmivora]
MDMLQRMIRLRPTLDKFFAYLCSPEGIKEFDDVYQMLQAPTSEEWFVIQCLVKLLSPFSAVSDHLGGDTYPTLVMVHASIRTLKLLLCDYTIFDDLYAPLEREPFASSVVSMMKSLRRSFVTLLERRFEKLDDNLLWISLLDPYFTNSDLLTAAETKRAKKRLKEEMLALAQSASSNTSNLHEPTTTASSRLTTRKPSSDARSLEKECEWEFKNYMRMSSAAQVEEQMHPSSLDWWRDNAKAFPRVAPLARKWLGCIATSVPSERAFCTAGNTITKRHSALTDDTVSDIGFISENKSQ